MAWMQPMKRLKNLHVNGKRRYWAMEAFQMIY